MKNSKKALCLSLVIVMIFSLTGCGIFMPKVTGESLLENAITFVDNAESVDVSVLISLDMSLDDESMQLNLQNDVQSHLESETAYINFKADGEHDGDEESLDVEMYIVEENGKSVNYYNSVEDGDETGWTKEQGGSIYELLPNTKKILKEIQKSVDSLKLETTKFNNKDCYMITGSIDGLETLFDLYDLYEIIGDIDADDLKVNLKLYFDKKTKTLCGIDAEMASGLEELYSEIEDLEDTEVDNFNILITYHSFNELDEIEVPKSIKKEAEKEPEISDEVVGTPTEPTDKEEDDEDEEGGDVIVPTNPSVETPAETTPAEKSEISDDWKDMDIKVDGVVYTFPYDYDEFKENGWYIELSKYGYEDGYILNKGDKVVGTINMYNDTYGKEYRDFSMWVGFKNYGDKAADILECDIWSIKLERTYGFKLKDKYPTIEIAKGIKWGATKDEIVAAFGPYDDIYEAKENGYVVYKYEDNYSKHMSLTIYDEFGLTCVEFSNYD